MKDGLGGDRRCRINPNKWCRVSWVRPINDQARSSRQGSRACERQTIIIPAWTVTTQIHRRVEVVGWRSSSENSHNVCFRSITSCRWNNTGRVVSREEIQVRERSRNRDNLGTDLDASSNANLTTIGINFARENYREIGQASTKNLHALIRINRNRSCIFKRIRNPCSTEGVRSNDGERATIDLVNQNDVIRCTGIAAGIAQEPSFIGGPENISDRQVPVN